MPNSNVKSQPVRQAQGKLSKVKSSTQKVKTVERVGSSVKKPAKTIEKKTNLSVPVYGLTGERKGSITLPESVFGGKINTKLMAQAVRVYQVNQRQGTASTKSRGEINLTKAKWYRQKGTGRARHGAQSAPIFVGGGVAFGPRPRKFELKMSKQMRRKALASSLAQVLAEDKLKVVELNGSTGKTQQIYKMFKKMNIVTNRGKDNILFIPQMSEAKRAATNIEGVEIFNATGINTYAVLHSKNIVIEKQAIKDLEVLFS